MSAPSAGHAHRPDVPSDRACNTAPSTPGDGSLVDHDEAARTALARRLITDIDQIHFLADTHDAADPDWREVTLLLGRMRATLSRDLPLLPLG